MFTTCLICFENWTVIKEEDIKDKSETNKNRLLLQRFCECFNIPLKHVGIKWNFSNENIPFCEECKKTAKKLVDLDKKVKLVQKTLKNTEEAVKHKIQISNQRQQDDQSSNDDSKDVRVKMLRDLIVLPHIRLNRISNKRINNISSSSRKVNLKIDQSSSFPPKHADDYTDDAYFDDYSPPPFNEDSILDEPDENSSTYVKFNSKDKVKVEKSGPDQQLHEVQGVEVEENGDKSSDTESVEFISPPADYAEEFIQTLWGKRKREKSSTTARTSKKRKTQNNNEENFSTKKRNKKLNQNLKNKSKSNEEHKTNSVDKIIGDDDDNDDLEVIDDFGQNSPEDLNLSDDGEGTEESVPRRPKRKTIGQSKKAKKNYTEGEGDGDNFELDDGNEEDDDDDNNYKDDPRDGDFILPDDTLNTVKEDLKLEQVVKNRMREKEKDPKRTKIVVHSAKKLEDGSYEYRGFKFTGSAVEGYSCSECPDRTIKNKRFQGIYTHIKDKHVNDGGRVCPICAKVLATANGLREHLKLHQDTDPWICDICGHGYKDQRGLEVHRSNVHFPEFNHICDICGNAYKRLSFLNTHKRRVHESLKRFFCEECGKGFFSANDLVRHKALHSTDRPFACSQCGQTFRRAEHRRRHFKQFHDFKAAENVRARDNLSKRQRAEKIEKRKSAQETGEPLDVVPQKAPQDDLKCQYCGLQYNRQNNLTRHILQIHKIDIKGVNWKSRNKYHPPTDPLAITADANTTTTTIATTTTAVPNSEGVEKKKKRTRKRTKKLVEKTSSPTTTDANICIKKLLNSNNLSYEKLPPPPPVASSYQTNSVPSNTDSPNNWNMSFEHFLSFQNPTAPSSSMNHQ